jgi:hypothetical protein
MITIHEGIWAKSAPWCLEEPGAGVLSGEKGSIVDLSALCHGHKCCAHNGFRETAGGRDREKRTNRCGQRRAKADCNAFRGFFNGHAIDFAIGRITSPR